jgi:hypothetical protein
MPSLSLASPILRTIAIVLIAAAAHAQPGETVAGQVISRLDGAPIRKASVLLRAAGDNALTPRDSFLTEANSEGHFAVSGVPPGIYECIASHSGFATKSVSRTGVVPQINVVRGQPVAGLVLRLMPFGVISGRVLDAEGDPVSNANVDALQYNYSTNGKTLAIQSRVTTNDRGEFRLFGLYPGAYYVRAMPQGDRIEGSTVSLGSSGFFRTYALTSRAPVRGPVPPPLHMTFYPGETDASKAVAIDVPAGAEARPIEIRLDRLTLHSIRGATPAGSSLSFVIEKRPFDHTFQWGGMQSQRDGIFEIPALPPGSYSLTAQRIIRGDHTFSYARAIVEVGDADVEGVGLTFSPGVQISGTVKPDGRTPVELGGLTITLRGNEGSRWNSRANVTPEGTFAITNILPGLYHFTVDPPDSNQMQSSTTAAYATSIKLGDTELADQVLDLRSPISEVLKVTVSGEMGRIEGNVLDDKGQPSPKVYVTLVPDQSKWDWQYRYRDTFADAEDRYSFTAVVPGSYTLMSWQDVEHGAPMDADFRRPFDQLGTPVEVLPGGRLMFNLKAIDTDKHP